MPDQPLPDDSPDTKPNPPLDAPELPEAEPTRHQQPHERTRAMPTVVPPPGMMPSTPQRPVPTAPQPMAHTGEKPKRGQRRPAQPKRAKADIGFYLPLWSIGFMLLLVAGTVTCFVLLVLSLGGRQTPDAGAPRFVIITAAPTLPGQETLPVLLVSPTLPEGFGPGFQGTIPAFALAGPTLEPIVFTPTPSPAPQIQVGSIVAIVSDGGANIRNAPGMGNAVVTVGRTGQQFSVIGGPQIANDLTWWQLRSADSTITGWAAENDGTNDLIAVVTP